MQIEKKLIAWSILAIVIGVGTIVPLEYMMGAEVQANAELPKVEPSFNVSVSYAYCNPYKAGENFTTAFDGAMIQMVANFTLAPNALENADAQIEYYKFAVSSEQGLIINMGYYIVLESNPGIVVGIGGPKGTVTFENGLIYNGPSNDGQNIDYGCGGQGMNYNVWEDSYTLGFVSKYIFGTDHNNLPQAVTDIRNAQTLYVDVSKVSTVTIKGHVTVTTPASNDILQHIELTKTDSGFLYGSYVEGTLPIPIETP
jgi:hypothetical protein